MQKAEVAGAPKPFWQHMLKDQPQEMRAGNGPAFHLSCLGVSITEAHLTVVAGDDIGLPDDAPVKIAPQVDEGRIASADGFAIHHPLRRVTARKRQSGGFDGRQHLRPENLGQGLVVEQIAAFPLSSPFGSPLLLLAIERCRRHDEMDMRVVLQLARVRMQHRDGAGRALKLLVVLAERTHRLPATAHEQIVEDALMRPAQPPEFGRQGEREQKVLGGHAFLHLAFQPLLTLMVLTVRAVAMAAGVRNQDLMLASRTLDLHLGADLATAVFHGRERPIVIRRESAPVLREEVCFEEVDDRSQPDHLTCPQVRVKPSIKPLIRSMA